MNHGNHSKHETLGNEALAAQMPAGHGDQQDHGEHGDHGHHDPAQFRDRFWITLALTLPVMFFSEMFQELLGYTAPSFPGSTWISPVLGTVIFAYGE